MSYTYKTKVMVSGKQVESYSYKKPVWRDFSRKKFENVNTHKEPEQTNIFKRITKQKEKKKSSLNRTRTEIRRLTNSNPQLNKFLTLTFSDNITDLKQANYIFNKFILRITYKYSNFEYLTVPEFQKRGAVHYHLLCKLPFVHYKELTDIWGQGNIDIKKIQSITNLGAYVCKYLSKDMFDERTFGKKKFFRSQTLKKPIEILGWSAEKFIEKYLKNSTPTFEKTFNSEYMGEVDYKAFSLDHSPFDKDVYDKKLIFEKYD